MDQDETWHGARPRPSYIVLDVVMFNGNRLTGYWFTSLETGSQSEKPVNAKFLSLYYVFIHILIILLMLTDRKINNHAVRQPFPRYSNIIYMLPAMQLQKNVPP